MLIMITFGIGTLILWLGDRGIGVVSTRVFVGVLGAASLAHDAAVACDDIGRPMGLAGSDFDFLSCMKERQNRKTGRDREKACVCE